MVLQSLRIMVTIMVIMTMMVMSIMMIMVMVIIMMDPAYSHHKKSHHGGEMSEMMKVGMCQCQKRTIHHDELYFGVFMYQEIHITSGSFGMNFKIESAAESGSA